MLSRLNKLDLCRIFLTGYLSRWGCHSLKKSNLFRLESILKLQGGMALFMGLYGTRNKLNGLFLISWHLSLCIAGPRISYARRRDKKGLACPHNQMSLYWVNIWIIWYMCMNMQCNKILNVFLGLLFESHCTTDGNLGGGSDREQFSPYGWLF